MKDSTIKINLELVGYEEFIDKLEKIKKLLNEIKNIQIEVK